MIVGDVTADWLAKLLQVDGTIKSVAATVLGEGVGFVSQVLRLDIDHDDATLPGGEPLPASMIAKLPIPDDRVRVIAGALRLYEREAWFYELVAPQLQFGVPRCFHSEADSEGRMVLLLEHLPDRATDLLDSCSTEEAARVLEVAAELHAAWEGRTGEGMLADVPGRDAPEYSLLAMQFEQTIPALASWAGFTPERAALIGRIATQMGSLRADLWDRHPTTLIHSDLRLGNLIFGGSQGVSVVDWQTLARGPGLFDVAYFVGSSLDPDVRRAELDGLLAHYRAELARRRVPTPPVAELLPDVARGLMLALGTAVVTRATVDSPADDRAGAGLDRWLDRLLSAIEDLGGADLL